MRKMGWFTTARDEDALSLLRVVWEKIREGFIPLEIAYVFVSKDRGESPISDKLIRYAEEEMKVPTITFSALKFKEELRKRDLEQWRELYHREILNLLPVEVDFGMLAGYMWIVSSEFCKKIPLLNLHPALPGGPKGTWQEVIWQLISARSRETGVMIHQATSELDEGPPLTYVRFSIYHEEILPLWEKAEKILLRYHLRGLREREGESNPLFRKIRQEGVKRELPLIVLTLKYFAEGRINWYNEDLPLDLTEQVEAYLNKGGL